MNDNQKILVGCILVVLILIFGIMTGYNLKSDKHSYDFIPIIGDMNEVVYQENGWDFYEINHRSYCDNFGDWKFIVIYPNGWYSHSSIPIYKNYRLNKEYCSFKFGDKIAVYRF